MGDEQEPGWADSGRLVLLAAVVFMVGAAAGCIFGALETRSRDAIASIISDRVAPLENGDGAIVLAYLRSNDSQFATYELSTGKIRLMKRIPPEWSIFSKGRLRVDIPEYMAFALAGAGTVSLNASQILKPSQIIDAYRANPANWRKSTGRSASRVVTTIVTAISGYYFGHSVGWWIASDIFPPSPASVEASLSDQETWKAVMPDVYSRLTDELSKRRHRIATGTCNSTCTEEDIAQLVNCHFILGLKKSNIPKTDNIMIVRLSSRKMTQGLCPETKGAAMYGSGPTESDFRDLLVALYALPNYRKTVGEWIKAGKPSYSANGYDGF